MTRATATAATTARVGPSTVIDVHRSGSRELVRRSGIQVSGLVAPKYPDSTWNRGVISMNAPLNGAWTTLPLPM